MKHLYLIPAICFFQQFILAQTLLPYLGTNGLYGYATESGKVVVEPAFGELSPLAAHEVAMECNQNGKPVTLLRNGMVLEGKCLPSNKPVENYPPGRDDDRLDTLGHLAFLYKGAKVLFVNFNKKTTAEYLSNDRQLKPDWFFENHWMYTSFSKGWKFRLGSFKVFKAPDKINFIDTDLNEIFDRDFAAGSVLDEQHFAVAEGPGRIAVADRNGKVRTPFMWNSIRHGGKNGFFIVNSPLNSSKLPGKAGLIDANGKIIIDTVYSFIQPVNGGQVLIVRNRDKVGLMDYAGHIVLPVEASEIYPNESGNRMAAHWNYSHNILNENGEKILPENAQTVSSISKGGLELFQVMNPYHQAIVDTNGRVLVSDSLASFSVFNTEPLIFKMEKGKGDQQTYSLLDARGKPLAGGEYEMIRDPYRQLAGVFEVRQNGLHGIIDAKGKVLLPVRFEEIKLEFITNDSVNVWGKNKESGLWSAYDMQLKKLPLPDYFLPDSKQEKVFEIQYSGGGKVVVLQDGSVRPLPDSLSKIVAKEDVRTPEGGIVLLSEKHLNQVHEVKALNHRFENIIPGGFLISKKFKKENEVDKTGLLVVYKNPLPGGEVVPPAGTPPPASRGSSLPDVGNHNAICGVLNALGEWVLPPKKGVRYIPMSHDVVAEVEFYERFKSRIQAKKPFRIHLLAQPGRPVMEVQYMQREQFWDEMPTMMIGRWDDASKQILKAWFDNKGKQLTPFYVIDGPSFLFSRNPVFILGEGGKKHQVIMDRQGKIIKDLGNWWNPVESSLPLNWTLDYLVVFDSEPLPDSYKNRTLKNYDVTKIAKQTDLTFKLVDSTGNWVLPGSFKQIEVVKPGKLLWVIDESGATQLLDWKGRSLHAFGQKEELKFHLLSDGRTLVGSNSQTVLVSAEEKVVKTFPIGYTPAYKQPLFEDEYFRGTDAVGKICWASLRDGRVFKG